VQRSSPSVGQTGGWAELVSQPRSVGRTLWSSFDRRGDPPPPNHTLSCHGSVKTTTERRAPSGRPLFFGTVFHKSLLVEWKKRLRRRSSCIAVYAPCRKPSADREPVDRTEPVRSGARTNESPSAPDIIPSTAQ